MMRGAVALQSRHLFTRELRDPDVSVACAKVMAQFNRLTMPMVKQPRWLFDTMTRYAPRRRTVTHTSGDVANIERKIATQSGESLRCSCKLTMWMRFNMYSVYFKFSFSALTLLVG